MRYEFTADLEVGDKTIGQLDGYAVLGRQHGESWRVDAIHLDCFPFGTVEVPAEHYLHQPVELWLRKHQSLAMDEAWARHRAEQKSEAAA